MDGPGFEWFRFYNGGDNSTAKTVCRLPHDIKSALRSSTDVLRIQLDYVRKSIHKHNLRFDHFPMMELAVRFGSAYLDPKGISFFYTDKIVFGSNFFVAIKYVQHKNELWVRTFHRKSGQEVRRITKKLHRVRTQLEF